MEQRSKGSTAVPNLPLDVIMIILYRLPVKCLLRFRCVCKSWRNLISEPSFVEMHLRRSIENNLNLIISKDFFHFYSIDYNVCEDEKRAVKLNETQLPNFMRVCSCNGLLCLSNRDNAFLWNPSTREVKQLPDCPVKFQSGIYYSWGIGYDPKANEYKVIRIANIYKSELHLFPHQTEVMICTLGTDLWRSLENIPWFIDSRVSAMVVGGVPHWLATKRGSCIKQSIISFDVRVEEFREVQWPMNNCNGQQFCLLSRIYLGVIRGCLSILSRGFGECLEIYVMKEYGIRESWTKEFKFRLPIEYRDVLYSMSFGFLKNGEVLLLQSFRTKLLLYNPENDKVSDVSVRGYRDWAILGSYAESLVSLESKNGIEEPQQV
ncbi:F-box protein CPR1-like [Macadamia integrifolia]|uniref:F-box protein CPR1-like n=1 Tax=Macadamia integrifolia TaxID=60698 RepID=UPI001C4FA83C|nr:F-box protein CPR1-like [Macadamia integrifolia]XP_042518378.1 F-box protein CPR1-like [Macadamia integrifolia]XP_042518379.1 F-box protein CPR1-like [Macadamia integrifolia]XP_042518380.1 F-box protein CPR1-like [Macadamia integrifolia]